MLKSQTLRKLLIYIEQFGFLIFTLPKSYSNFKWLFLRCGVLCQGYRKQGVQSSITAFSDVVQVLKDGEVIGVFMVLARWWFV